MGDIKWIKLNTHMFEDEKIRLIEQMPDGDAILIIWIKLLSQAGKTNASGYIFLNESIPYTDEMLATIFRRNISTVRLALETFKRFGMIDIDEESFIRIENWEKHQNIEGMEKIREQNRLRKARQREKESNQLENGHVTVTQSHATELELEEDKEKEYIYTIFEHWNEQRIIKHKKMNQSMKSHINARLEENTVDELLKAITNLKTIISDDRYYWTHKWTLQDFMKPNNVVRFLDENEPFKEFAVNKGKIKQNPKEQINPTWKRNNEHIEKMKRLRGE